MSSLHDVLSLCVEPVVIEEFGHDPSFKYARMVNEQHTRDLLANHNRKCFFKQSGLVLYSARFSKSSSAALVEITQKGRQVLNVLNHGLVCLLDPVGDDHLLTNTFWQKMMEFEPISDSITVRKLYFDRIHTQVRALHDTPHRDFIGQFVMKKLQTA